MKGKGFIICLIALIVVLSLTFSNAISFAFYEPARTTIAKADEMDQRFSEAQEEEMIKEEEWYVIPGDDNSEIIIPEPDEDNFKNPLHKFDTEDEDSPEPYEFEEKELEDEPSMDTESRR